MDKLDFAILNTLGEVSANTRLKAVTRKQLLEIIDIGAQNLFLRINKLIVKGVVDKGLKDGREHTYYITAAGTKELEEALK